MKITIFSLLPNTLPVYTKVKLTEEDKYLV